MLFSSVHFNRIETTSTGLDSLRYTISIFAAFPSVIRGLIETQTIIRGHVTKLTCQGKGDPGPTIAWLKNGQRTTNNSRVTISSSESGDKSMTSELVITDTKYEDSGVYTCVIDNTVGGTNSSGTISVHGNFVN